MRISVDPEQCYGSGDCVHRAPAVFTQVDGLGAVIPGREHDVDAPRVREAAEGCPSAAITITLTGAEEGPGLSTRGEPAPPSPRPWPGSPPGTCATAPAPFGKAALATRWLNRRLREHPRRAVVEARSGDLFAVDTPTWSGGTCTCSAPGSRTWRAGCGAGCGRGDGFVDVGANIGIFSVLAARLVGDGGRVVAIEASPDLHRHLVRNVRLNALSNVRALNAAVSDRARTLTFALASSRNTGANSIVPYDGPVESSFRARAQPLPELLDAAETAAARVIKIDVEGAEGSVVRGLAPIWGLAARRGDHGRGVARAHGPARGPCRRPAGGDAGRRVPRLPPGQRLRARQLPPGAAAGPGRPSACAGR
ncbi:hypothetical protein SVIOM342S_03588 [Streptomyces violaceorubidus]